MLGRPKNYTIMAVSDRVLTMCHKSVSMLHKLEIAQK